uniref:Uncharacterized protein n=1 Tax=uncultured Rhodospirillales bacterium HF4000_24M03 TaxID=710788 RepID=E0XW38_9PROT|nr:hypothetical protein [uncultured Rhodospirillales bacterium HF4000_24M03]
MPGDEPRKRKEGRRSVTCLIALAFDGRHLAHPHPLRWTQRAIISAASQLNSRCKKSDLSNYVMCPARRAATPCVYHRLF